VHLYFLSIGSNGFGIEVKYEIVKDFCTLHEADHLEIYPLLKRVANEVHAKK
jgi:hypothetical protein